jgi:DNA-binding CsgD family transcriptional regulator
MGRRGRRPHPDILTPREWEVLDLLRERLTNEQIAERLGITLDGAKYHVSQILSKLGVATREEATATEPAERRRWWQRLIALPVAARIAGAGTMIAAAAGLALLAWSVFTTETKTERDPVIAREPAVLPSPQSTPRFTRDQALLRSAGGEGDIAFVDAQPSELGAILRYLDGPLPPEIPELAGRRSTVTAWLVTTVGHFPPPDAGPPGPHFQTAVAPEIACREISVVFRDRDEPDPANGPFSSYSVSNALPDAICYRKSELTLDLAVVYGARAISDRLAPFFASPAVDAFLPREVPAEQTTFEEAANSLRDEGALEAVSPSVADDDERVWSLRFRGPFSYSPQTSRNSAAAAVCTEVIVVIHAETGEPLLTRDEQLQDC